MKITWDEIDKAVEKKWKDDFHLEIVKMKERALSSFNKNEFFTRISNMFDTQMNNFEEIFYNSSEFSQIINNKKPNIKLMFETLNILDDNITLSMKISNDFIYSCTVKDMKEMTNTPQSLIEIYTYTKVLSFSQQNEDTLKYIEKVTPPKYHIKDNDIENIEAFLAKEALIDSEDECSDATLVESMINNHKDLKRLHSELKTELLSYFTDKEQQELFKTNSKRQLYSQWLNQLTSLNKDELKECLTFQLPSNQSYQTYSQPILYKMFMDIMDFTVKYPEEQQKLETKGGVNLLETFVDELKKRRFYAAYLQTTNFGKNSLEKIFEPIIPYFFETLYKNVNDTVSIKLLFDTGTLLQLNNKDRINKDLSIKQEYQKYKDKREYERVTTALKNGEDILRIKDVETKVVSCDIKNFHICLLSDEFKNKSLKDYLSTEEICCYFDNDKLLINFTFEGVKNIPSNDLVMGVISTLNMSSKSNIAQNLNNMCREFQLLAKLNQSEMQNNKNIIHSSRMKI